MSATMQTPTGVQFHEFFAGKTDKIAQEKMNDRIALLQSRGHTLIRKQAVGRNDPCPCGSGHKYKKCHIGTEW